MICAWKELVGILPGWMALDVDRLGNKSLQELRLRLGFPPELVLDDRIIPLQRPVKGEDLNYIINISSRYSPWTAQTIASGYLTAAGGHRIGICGEAVVKEGVVTGIRNITSLCIRIARDFPGIAEQAARKTGSVLLIGPPGSGKTTLLRDLIRQIARREPVSVVDERGEIFPEQWEKPPGVDVLTGSPKNMGISMVLRNMSPRTIAVDEITDAGDCKALIMAGWCGVRLIATAHAASVKDLMQRPVYQPMISNHLFNDVLVLSRDKTWREERLMI